LTSIVRSGRQKGPGRQRPGLFVQFPSVEPRVALVYFYRKEPHSIGGGKPFALQRLVSASSRRNEREAETVMDSQQIDSQPIDRSTSRSICDAVGERLQQDLRPEATPLSPYLQHLLEELNRRDGESHRRSSH